MAATPHLDPAPSGFERLRLPAGYPGGVFDHQASRFSPMARDHTHREWEFNLVVRGSAGYVIDGRRITIERDGLLWLLPQHRHLLLDRSEDFRMWIAVIPPSTIRRLSADPVAHIWRRWLRGAEVAPPYRLVGEAETRRLSQLLATLEHFALPPAHHAAGLAFATAQAWSAYCDAPNRPAGSHLHPAVRTAIDWLADHAATPEADDLDALAERCHVSRPHLSRLFRKQTGQTLTAFRNRQRVERFTQLAGRGGQLSLTQAAYAAGFGSYTHAYRAVLSVTGQSPRGLIFGSDGNG